MWEALSPERRKIGPCRANLSEERACMMIMMMILRRKKKIITNCDVDFNEGYGESDDNDEDEYS